jgi:hypothetical protein
MKFFCEAAVLSTLVVSSPACGQKSTEAKSQSGPPPVELKLTKTPRWKDNCLEVSVQRTNLSKSSVFFDATYSDGLKIYSSVNDAANTLGQGAGEAWMLVYGWTDVVREPIKLGPGARRRSTLCIPATFPVNESGKEILRQVRVQGKLRIVAEYEIPALRLIHQRLGKGKGAYVLVPDISSRGTFGEVVIEMAVPCPNGTGSSDCLSPPPIFLGEHDVHTIELEPPHLIEIQPPAIPIFPTDRPPPPKP